MENNEKTYSMSFEARMRGLGWSSVSFVPAKEDKEEDKEENTAQMPSDDFDER